MNKKFKLHHKDSFNDYADDITITIDDNWECPMCGKGVNPTFIDGLYIEPLSPRESNEVFLVLRCHDCEENYVSRYQQNFRYGEDCWEYIESMPNYPQPIHVPPDIKELSPKFCEIYRQCVFAYSNPSLKGLTGVGLRKSIEFLIKDYLIKMEHQDKNTIIQLDLGKCIEKFNGDMKILAKASTWIGNDETHYFRKNPTYDTEDLFDFICALVDDMHNQIVTKKANQLTSKK